MLIPLGFDSLQAGVPCKMIVYKNIRLATNKNISDQSKVTPRKDREHLKIELTLPPSLPVLCRPRPLGEIGSWFWTWSKV